MRKISCSMSHLKSLKIFLASEVKIRKGSTSREWQDLRQFKEFFVVRGFSHSGFISLWKVFFPFSLDILSDWDYHIWFFWNASELSGKWKAGVNVLSLLRDLESYFCKVLVFHDVFFLCVVNLKLKECVMLSLCFPGIYFWTVFSTIKF